MFDTRHRCHIARCQTWVVFEDAGGSSGGDSGVVCASFEDIPLDDFSCDDDGGDSKGSSWLADAALGSGAPPAAAFLDLIAPLDL